MVAERIDDAADPPAIFFVNGPDLSGSRRNGAVERGIRRLNRL